MALAAREPELLHRLGPLEREIADIQKPSPNLPMVGQHVLDLELAQPDIWKRVHLCHVPVIIGLPGQFQRLTSTYCSKGGAATFITVHVSGTGGPDLA